MENDGNRTAAQPETFREEDHGDHLADHHDREVSVAEPAEPPNQSVDSVG